MARGLNKVQLIGTLGKDPETRQMLNGNAVANITLATSESWKDKNTGQKQEKTEWHRVVFFGKGAEIAGQYLTKGSLVYIEGRIETKKWQDKSGQDRYTTQIIADKMNMLGGGQRGAQQQSNQGGRYNNNQGGQQGGGYQEPQQGGQQHQSNNGEMDVPEDDIPF